MHEFKSMQFIETLCGAICTTVVKYGAKDQLIAGLEDGTVGVLDLNSTNGNSYKRPIFKMSNQNEAELDTPHSQFQELALEHEDSIVSVEANVASASADTAPLVITASKDGSLYVWRLHASGEEMLQYVADDYIEG